MLYRYHALINMNARLFMCNFKPLDLRTIITQKQLFLCALLLCGAWTLGLYCDTGSMSYGLLCLAPIKLFRNEGGGGGGSVFSRASLCLGRRKVSTMAGFVLNSGVTPAGQGGVLPS